MSNATNVLNHGGSDDPRLLLGEPFRAVHFVFGLFHPQIRSLSGRALLGSLAALGFGDQAARGIILRLRRGGFVESHRSGREAVYSLSPRSVALVDEIARRSSEPPPPWDSTFETLVVHIPADERAYREVLRRQAAYAGFGTPVPGLLIAPYPASLRGLLRVLAARPASVRVTRGRLTVDASDVGVLAATAWDLGPRAAALRREADRMHAIADEVEARTPAGADALAALWQGIGPFFELLSERPPLPSVLLPDDWPMDAARAAFVRLAVALAGPAHGFVEGLDAAQAASRGAGRPGTGGRLPGRGGRGA